MAPMPAPPDSWTHTELKKDAKIARQRFVKERLAALPSERATYTRLVTAQASAARLLLKASDNLRSINATALRDRKCLNLARYVAVPPISLDDLDTITDSCFEAWVGQTTERGARPTDEAFDRAADFISQRLDRSRAPWLSRTPPVPKAAELDSFVMWIASLPAMSGVVTSRRTERAKSQEELTRRAVEVARYTPVVPPSPLRNPLREMDPGTFSLKSRSLTRTSIDVPVRLRAGHPTGLDFLAVECKVSNSTLNSRKRLLEVNRKREVWDRSGLRYRHRTAAVIAGVFDVERLVETQDDGVMIFWEHRLRDLTRYVR